jgi:sulfofructose kinase
MTLPTPPPAGKAYDVVGFGLNSVDHLCRIGAMPASGSKRLLDAYECLPGGQVATAMVALKRWGLRSAYIGAFGDDAFGEIVQRALAAEGLGIEGSLTRAGVPNELAVILVEGVSGERTVLWHRDARLAVRPDELDRERICAGRALHLDGVDRAAAIQAAVWATEAGIPTVIDLEGSTDRLEELLGYVDVAIISRDYAVELGLGSPETAAALLARFGCTLTAVTLGADGVVARCDDHTLRVPAFPITAVDTTGAGDVFHAGVIYGLLSGWEVERILHFASAAAALQCTQHGAQAGIPPLDAVAALAH